VLPDRGASGRDEPGPARPAPLADTGLAATAGIVDSGGIAVLTADEIAPAAGPRQLALEAAGFGPHGAELGARCWPRTCRPGMRQVSPARPAAGGRLSAIVGGRADPSTAGHALLIERAATPLRCSSHVALDA